MGLLREPEQVIAFMKSLDEFTPTKLKERDLIALRVEGTGFAARTDAKALKVEKGRCGGGGGW